jgi:hypothetical protein
MISNFTKIKQHLLHRFWNRMPYANLQVLSPIYVFSARWLITPNFQENNQLMQSSEQNKRVKPTVVDFSSRTTERTPIGLI